MILQRTLFYCVNLISLVTSYQINLYLTHVTNNTDNDIVIQHDCLYAPIALVKEKDSRQIMSYCISQWPSTWNISESQFKQTFTFARLKILNITSQDLYRWSAPIDTAEKYQLYLDQSLISNVKLLDNQLYYNCTMPFFGSMCQYSMDDYNSDHLSLSDTIHEIYSYSYEPTEFTCYTHLKCNRGLHPACLDWTEICDGKIDCIDGGQDEDDCWQLEINVCRRDEYRCVNGQCIPKSFFRDDPISPDCADRSDEIVKDFTEQMPCKTHEPSFGCEDAACTMGSIYALSPLTSSCVRERSDLLLKSMFMNKPDHLNDSCWLAIQCIVHIPNTWINRTCATICRNGACSEMIKKSCPEMFYVPNIPILFGQVYFAYLNHNSSYFSWSPDVPEYICFRTEMCGTYFFNVSSFMFNNTICYRPNDLGLGFMLGRVSWVTLYVTKLYNLLWKCHSIFNKRTNECNETKMYKCIDSTKCITRSRLLDSVVDCFYRDDENITVADNDCALDQFETHFKCTESNQCIPHRLVGDGRCDCQRIYDRFCEDELPYTHRTRNRIIFQTICDGFNEMIPTVIDGRNETDETECELWQCNNAYTRCDGVWNCVDGSDEIDCSSSSILTCPLQHHHCVDPKTKELSCVHIEKVNDGKVDCFGATDEVSLCQVKNFMTMENYFYCKGDDVGICLPVAQFCNYGHNCPYGEDEAVCSTNREPNIYNSVCEQKFDSMRSDVEEFLCQRLQLRTKSEFLHFLLERTKSSIAPTSALVKSTNIIRSPLTQQYQKCHRGFPLRVWYDKDRNSSKITCVCPPSFYGQFCEYQNQRVALTMQFRALSEAWRLPFVFVVMLIDNSRERMIHSYEQMTYLPIRDCLAKFNIYLLYLKRPKDYRRNYSVHIDVFEKLSLVYRGSWLLPLKFPFLPVHRLAVLLNIPHSFNNSQLCSNKACVHGRCVKYSNVQDDNSHFCQCYAGWSGRHCTIPHNCTCSTNSLCIGILANDRPLCVCSINRFGPHCVLDDPVCKHNTETKCLNGGQCIPNDEHDVLGQKFTCICPKHFSGSRCEIADNEIVVSFHKDIVVSQSILVHFIHINEEAPPDRATTFRAIRAYKDTVSIYWSRPFHIVFIELFNQNYYLTVVQKAYESSAKFSKTIYPSDRCLNISEVFNETIVKLHPLRRIKHYHVPCQQRSSPLLCFYDETFFCLCQDHGSHRTANCFEFEHQMRSDCLGQSSCENGGQCFQDSSTCAQTSMCVCSTCYYGTRCQFSTNDFGLSLDAILGYHILPGVSFQRQPTAVKVSAVITTLIVFIGLINGVLSLITFRSKQARKIGSSIYLMGSSITSLLIMVLLGIKYWILVTAQMFTNMNRSFLYVQCLLLDFLLRVFLTLDQFVNGCVAAERAATVIRKAKFNKKKSKMVAKYLIIALLAFSFGICVHDPMHRRLFEDENEEDRRIWCIVTYSSSFQYFNSISYLVCYLFPFVVNLISALIIIISNTRQRSALHNHQTFRYLLFNQFQKHNRLLITPLLLVIFGVPRVIISFMSGCMKSTQDSWLFLSGYYISFIPPMLSFIIFILPSTFYMEQFRKSILLYKKMIQQHLGSNS